MAIGSPQYEPRARSTSEATAAASITPGLRICSWLPRSLVQQASLAPSTSVRDSAIRRCGIACAIDLDGVVVGIDDDLVHTTRATEIAADVGFGDRVHYVTGKVRDVLPNLDGPFDMIHDDAWFAKTPDHLEAMLELLRPGGLLTMANWFLLVDAITGTPRNDWNSFAGPHWADDTLEYAHLLASRRDLQVTWVTTPPIAFATSVGSPPTDH